MYEIFKFKSATDTTCMNLKSGNQSKVYAFKFFLVALGTFLRDRQMAFAVLPLNKTRYLNGFLEVYEV